MIAFIIATAIAQPAPAASAPAERPPYRVHGIGGSSCASWTEARQQRDGTANAARISWLGGFVSAHNALLGVLQNRSDLLGGSNLDEAAGWVDAYCRRNPREELHYAAQELVSELLSRQRRPAGQGAPR